MLDAVLKNIFILHGKSTILCYVITLEGIRHSYCRNLGKEEGTDFTFRSFAVDPPGLTNREISFDDYIDSF